MEIVLVNICDGWKSHYSMSLVGVIEPSELPETLFEMAKHRTIEVKALSSCNEGPVSKTELMNFFKSSTIQELNNGIDYLYLKSVDVGTINFDGSRI